MGAPQQTPEQLYRSAIRLLARLTLEELERREAAKQAEAQAEEDKQSETVEVEA